MASVAARGRRRGRGPSDASPPPSAPRPRNARGRLGRRPRRQIEEASAEEPRGPGRQAAGPRRSRRLQSSSSVGEGPSRSSSRLSPDLGHGPSSSARTDEAPSESPPATATPPPASYPHVVARSRRVLTSTIAAKWTPLTGPSLSFVSAVLQQAHRPILQRFSHTSQIRTHTSTSLRLVSRRIARKISQGLPFPPASMPTTSRGSIPSDAGRESELDFENVLNGKAALRRQLEPTTDAVKILRQEKERVEAELEKDYEALRELEVRARAHAREHKAMLKKAHVLAPSVVEPVHQERDEGAPESSRNSSATTTILSLASDPELGALAVQLGHHVDSIRSNLKQADGILPEVARSRALLRAVLLRHLPQDQYEDVVLGS